jgi:chaperone BCS1
MFIRMFASAHAGATRNVDLDLGDNGFRELTLKFSSHIPENTFTPTQMQGCLLRYRDSAADPAAVISRWIGKEQATILEAKFRIEKGREE